MPRTKEAIASWLVVMIVATSVFGVFFNQPAPASAAVVNGGKSVLPSPTYQFASWNGGGLKLVFGPQTWNDFMVQSQYENTGSLILPWSGVDYANWCNHANTTTTDISTTHYGSGNIYSSNIANLILKYKMPFMIQIPLDGYFFQCPSWATDVVAQNPQLRDYNWTTAQKVNNILYTSVRLDHPAYSVQLYNDLINLYNNLKATNPALLQYWYGVYSSKMGADHGDYPKYGGVNGQIGICPVMCDGTMTATAGNATVANFAQSPLCVSGSNSTVDGFTGLAYGSCAELARMARGKAHTISGRPCCNTFTIRNVINSQHNSISNHQYQKFDDYEYYLGISYAASNFTNHENLNHPFNMMTSWNPIIEGGGWLSNPSTSLYPYPYNTTYVRGLDLLNKFLVWADPFVENGNAPTSYSVSQDLYHCSHNLTPAGSPGYFVINGMDGPYATRYAKNSMYMVAYCAGSSTIAFGNFPYSPSAKAWPTVYGFGQLLDRMANLGSNQFSPVLVTKSNPSTNVNLLGGNGAPLLMWFYTNKTTTESAAVRLDPAAYGINGNWVAISTLNWSVVASGKGSQTFSVSIPARGWNPVYVLPVTSNLMPVYSNVPVSPGVSGGVGSYTVNSPKAFSSWLVVNTPTAPSSVSTSNSGLLARYSSLTLLNASVVGMKPIALSFVNQTQTGWYFDSTNGLTYIHFVGSSSVKVTVVTPTSGTTSTSWSTTSATSSTSPTTSSTMTTTSLTGISSTTVTSSLPTTSTSISSTSTVSTNSSVQASMTLSITSTSSAVSPGETISAGVQVTFQGTTCQPIGLTASGLPPGVNPTFTQTQSYPYSAQMSAFVPTTSSAGTYSVNIQASCGTFRASDTFVIQIIANANDLKVTLIASPTQGGSTSPAPGFYLLPSGGLFNASARAHEGWNFDHWELNGTIVGYKSHVSLPVSKNNSILSAVFYPRTGHKAAASVTFLDAGSNMAVLQVDGSNYSYPSSFSWDTGSIHNITASSYTGLRERTVFTGWAGPISGGSEKITIVAGENMYIIANYQTQIKIRLKFLDASGSALVPDNATLTGPGGRFEVPQNGSVWIVPGARYSLVSAYWEGFNVASGDLSISTGSSARTYSLGLDLFDAKVVFRDFLGNPIQGALVNVTDASGRVYTAYTDGQGAAVFPMLPFGTYSAVGQYFGFTYATSHMSPGGEPSTMTSYLSYPVFGILGLVLGGAVLGIVYRLLRVRSEKLSFDEFGYQRY